MFCVTDGAVIYALGDTPDDAISDFVDHGGTGEINRDGYQWDGRTSVVAIDSDLAEKVRHDGGNIAFDIVGVGRRSRAVIIAPPFIRS